MRFLHPPDDDGAMDLTMAPSAASTSSSTEQATQVVHPDSSGQPVQSPTPLKTARYGYLEKEDMEEEEGVEEEEEEAEVLVEKECKDMAVAEEIVEEEMESEGEGTAVAEEEQEHGPMTLVLPPCQSTSSVATTQCLDSFSSAPTSGTASATLSAHLSSLAGAATVATLRTPSAPMSSQSRNNSDPSSCGNCKCLELLKRVEALEAALKKMAKETPVAARTSMSLAGTSSDIQSTTAKKPAQRETLQKTPNSALKGEQVLKRGMKGTLYGKCAFDCWSVRLRSASRFWMIPPFHLLTY